MPFPVINETLQVGTTYSCDTINDHMATHKYNIVWRQTLAGCGILQLLQEMYRFNVTYIYLDKEPNITLITENGAIYPEYDDHIDIHTRPMSARLELLDFAHPIEVAFNWDFGFVLHQPESRSFFQTFYSKPFTRPLWNCLYGMALLVTITFCLMKRCEKRLIRGSMESSISYEMLMVIGGYCQHIPPIYGTMYARRTAYFVFFIFTYVIYSFYTSNLLSHLVNDRNKKFGLEDLAMSDIECVIIKNVEFSVHANNHKNLSIMEKKLQNIRSVSILEGIEGVKSGNTALLSDYMTLFPYIKTFDDEDLCKIIQINLLSNVKKYFFTSKSFRYKNEFKIGILRAKEAGVFRKYIFIDVFTPIDCDESHFQTGLLQISTPLLVLACTHFVSVIILLIEREHFRRNNVLPYVN